VKTQKDKFPFLALKHPWADNSNAIWLATSLKFYRNLAKYLFPAKLGQAERKEIFSLLSQCMLQLHSLKNPQVFKAEETGPLEKQFLYEHFIPSTTLQQAVAGEGFVFDETGEFFAILNIRDHLQLHLVDCTQELEGSWERLVKVETEIGSVLKYAFNPRFGFLTADPSYCGTGFSVHILLHLPALIQMGQLDDILIKHKEEEIAATGIQGNTQEILGDVVALYNTCTLGLTDENILQSLRTRATKLIVTEKSLRTQIRTNKDGEMKDKVSRAFGLLLHSYQIETIEAWKAISLLKLGLDIGWLEGVDHRALNDLLFACRRAHLISEYTEEIGPEAVPHLRAEFIHAALRNCHLTI
jgi:protein arginine kinase